MKASNRKQNNGEEGGGWGEIVICGGEINCQRFIRLVVVSLSLAVPRPPLCGVSLIFRIRGARFSSRGAFRFKSRRNIADPVRLSIYHSPLHLLKRLSLC